MLYLGDGVPRDLGAAVHWYGRAAESGNPVAQNRYAKLLAVGEGNPRGARELPPASVASLAQSLVTQVLYYLGDMGARGGDEMGNMDMAKHLIEWRLGGVVGRNAEIRRWKV